MAVSVLAHIILDNPQNPPGQARFKKKSVPPSVPPFVPPCEKKMPPKIKKYTKN